MSNQLQKVFAHEMRPWSHRGDSANSVSAVLNEKRLSRGADAAKDVAKKANRFGCRYS